MSFISNQIFSNRVTADPLIGTASWAINTVNAAVSGTIDSASHALYANVAGMAYTASWATQSISSSYASSSTNALSSSHALTSSYAFSSVSSSHALTASYFNGSVVSSSYSLTSSVTQQVSTSISTQNIQHNVLFVDTSGPGYIQVDAGLRYNPNQNLLTTTASYSLTASYVANASSFPFTGSAVISGSLQVTGSTDLTGSATLNGESIVTVVELQNSLDQAVNGELRLFESRLGHTGLLTTSGSVSGYNNNNFFVWRNDIYTPIPYSELDCETSQNPSTIGWVPGKVYQISTSLGPSTGVDSLYVAAHSYAQIPFDNNYYMNWSLLGYRDNSGNVIQSTTLTASVCVNFFNTFDQTTGASPNPYIQNLYNVSVGDYIAVISGSIQATNFYGTASYALTSAGTASSALTAISASYASSSTNANNANTASFIKTSGYGISTNFSGSTLILTASLRTVNGITPGPNGNVAVSLGGAVYTGNSASFAASSSGAITSSFGDGSIFIISDPAYPQLNGDSYIYTSNYPLSGTWNPLASINQAQADLRYLLLDGTNTMTGNLNMGNKSVSNMFNLVHGVNNSTGSDPNFPYHAEGYSTLAAGVNSHTEGGQTTTTENQPGGHAEGYLTTVDSSYSHAEGYNNITKGAFSHGEGTATTTIGQYSHAEGNSTTSKGNQSHSEGESTIAIGTGAHSEGNITTANGNYSHAEGELTKALGYGSHAEGNTTTAVGQFSHAQGNNTVAKNNYSFAVGQYNTISTSQVFAIGNGNSVTRSNVLEINDQNQLFISGNIFLSQSAVMTGTASYALNANTFPYVGTASINGGLNVTGSTVINGNLTVIGTASFGYFTSSQNSVSGTFVAATVISPGILTGGFKVVDTGSGNYASGTLSYTVNTGEWKFDQKLNINGNLTNGYPDVRAFGSSSHAEGLSSTAFGDYSHAEGSLTSAVGNVSHAEGFGSKAIALNSHAEGFASTVGGNSAHAEGFTTSANGDYSHTEGLSTTTAGQQAHAEGNSTKALGVSSHSEGESTTAVSLGSHTEGYLTTAKNNYAHAEGANTIAAGNSSHAEGESTLTATSAAYSHAEGYQTTASGSYSHSEGYSTTAIGFASHAEGLDTEATGVNSHAEGELTKSPGTSSHAEGLSTTSKGINSHSEGTTTIASGSYSHAEGFATLALGSGAHTEGQGTTAAGTYSHAEGNGAVAKGNYSHAEGQSTIAFGAYSHAEGNASIASGSNSHAEGNSTTAKYDYSHTSGLGTIAGATYQTVVGQYNTEDNSVFVVGNGTAAGTRNNILTVSGSVGAGSRVTVKAARLRITGSNSTEVPVIELISDAVNYAGFIICTGSSVNNERWFMGQLGDGNIGFRSGGNNNVSISPYVNTATGSTMTLTGTGIAGPMIRYRATAAQTLTSAVDTVINFATSLEDNNTPGLSYASGVFTNTSTVTRTWTITAMVSYASNNTGIRATYITKNGTGSGTNRISQNISAPTNGDGTFHTLSVTTQMAPGDTIRVYGYQTSAGNLSSGGAFGGMTDGYGNQISIRVF
jgi:hypothetical protein